MRERQYCLALRFLMLNGIFLDNLCFFDKVSNFGGFFVFSVVVLYQSLFSLKVCTTRQQVLVLPIAFSISDYRFHIVG